MDMRRILRCVANKVVIHEGRGGTGITRTEVGDRLYRMLWPYSRWNSGRNDVSCCELIIFLQGWGEGARRSE